MKQQEAVRGERERSPSVTQSRQRQKDQDKNTLTENQSYCGLSGTEISTGRFS